MTLLLFQRHAAQGDTLIEGNVVADFRRLADHAAHAVIDEQAAADGGARMDLDPRQHAPDVRQQAA